MENFIIYTPDIRQLVENVNIGPQAEVKELINSFNESYVQQSNHVDRYYRLQAPTKPLGITKKFYWKPGAYDTLKDILWRQSEMHKNANYGVNCYGPKPKNWYFKPTCPPLDKTLRCKIPISSISPFNKQKWS